MSLLMRRGRLQSLFAYLPEQTFNWENGQESFKASSDVDTRPANIPATWLRRPLRRLITPFARQAASDGVAFAGLTVIEGTNFEILEPRKLRGEIFPQTWICPICAIFHSGPRAGCPKGHGAMRQLVFVEYHRCGYIGGLDPPRCTNRCNAPMRLTGTSSRSFAEWSWVCSRCRRPADRNVYHGCRQCRSGTVRVLRPDASSVFYSQYVKVVNPPGEGEMHLLDSPRIYEAAVAQGLGRLPPGMEGLRMGVNDSDTEASQGSARRRLMEDFGLAEEEADELLARRARRTAEGEDWSGSVAALALDDETLADIGEECVELSLSLEASPLTFADLVTDAPSRDLAELYRRDYTEMLGRLGLADAILLREFPLAYVVVGYTREQRDPAKGVAFNFFPPTGGIFPMYGQRVVTEGILFRLDPTRVVDWLIDSGVVGPRPNGIEPTAWLYTLLQPIETVFEAPTDRITAAVLGLVHSVSHRVIAALGDRAGLRRESLSEHLMPYNLSFIIYEDTRSDFVLGGLEHVYRNYLAECLSGLPDAVRCVFDPPCQQGRGACAVCLYLSENSCERFNSALSRHFLFGGIHDGIRWTPYWKP
jgi:hypothetical protein